MSLQAILNTDKKFGSLFSETTDVESMSKEDIAYMASKSQARHRFFNDECARLEILDKDLDVTEFPNETLKVKTASDLDDVPVMYGVAEAYIKASGFNIIHCVDDRRGDWGDDTGYMVLILEKDKMYYALVLHINYNLDCRDLKHDIENNMKVFDSLEGVYRFYSDFADVVHNVIVRGIGDDSLTDKVRTYIEYMSLSYGEYLVQNYCNLKRIDLVEYEENFVIYSRSLNEAKLDFCMWDTIGNVDVDDLREDGSSLATSVEIV